LDITIIEFLLGAVAGTLSGILIVKRMGRNTPLPRTKISRKIARTKPRTALKQAKTRGAKPRSLRRLRSPVQPSETLSVEPMVTALAVNVSSCPTCGLQAPDALMAEHFLGSPSHENGTAESSVRSLLQMLVPPRAFGRRHQQRTFNPLSRLVRTIEDAQSALVQPLKGPK
jgi:hypothetical protein